MSSTPKDNGDGTWTLWVRGDAYLVDADDIERVRAETWHRDKRGYARNGAGVRMGAFILGPDLEPERRIQGNWSKPADRAVYHRNGERRDCRRDNLYRRGDLYISRRQRDGRWVVTLRVRGERIAKVCGTKEFAEDWARQAKAIIEQLRPGANVRAALATIWRTP